MAYEGWIDFGGVEIINVSRTAQLAEVLGIDTVWVNPDSVDWIQTELAGVDYDNVTTAPWYDPAAVASTEFAGVLPLSFTGMDDSTRESTPTEYITDGGNTGRPRHKTLAMVANIVLVASTDRGAEFGRRWLSATLANVGTRMFCSGVTMTYFRSPGGNGYSPEIVRRRSVAMTKGISVTRKRVTHCSATWMATFTLTAGDPFEYGDKTLMVENLGHGLTPTGPAVIAHGVYDPMYVQSCPWYDYSPIYDPLAPALVASPTAPDIVPETWGIVAGQPFERQWVQISPLAPSTMPIVPTFEMSSSSSTRTVRIGIWANDQGEQIQCEPLWGGVISYIPRGSTFYIDGEEAASYVWDGSSAAVRRTDSLTFSFDAKPLSWRAFNDTTSLFVTLDLFNLAEPGDGSDTLEVSLYFTPKSD